MHDFPDDALCKTCGYALRELPERRCPECGRWFNPSDPRTFNSSTVRPPGEWKPWSDRTRAIGLAVPATIFAWVWNGEPLDAYGLAALLLWPAALIFAMRHLRACADRFKRWTLVAIIAMLLLLTSGIIGHDRCPHGRFWHAGPYQWVVEGDFCGNPRKYRPWFWPASD